MITFDHDKLKEAADVFNQLGLELLFIQCIGETVREDGQPDAKVPDSVCIQISERPKDKGLGVTLTDMAERRSVNIRVVEHALGRMKTVRVRNFGQVDID